MPPRELRLGELVFLINSQPEPNELVFRSVNGPGMIVKIVENKGTLFKSCYHVKWLKTGITMIFHNDSLKRCEDIDAELRS